MIENFDEFQSNIIQLLFQLLLFNHYHNLCCLTKYNIEKKRTYKHQY